MRSGEDDAAFDAVIQDLCLAFNRPHTPELTRVFWESLKWAHIIDIRRMALAHRKTGKKFPTPKDLAPERSIAPPPKPIETEHFSSWAMAANKILFACCFQDKRGFKPVGPYDKHGNCLDDSFQKELLAAKRDYVGMAEEAERGGEVWDTVEFNKLCREGFQAIIARADQQLPPAA